MHPVVMNELTKSRIDDFHRQAERYRLSHVVSKPLVAAERDLATKPFVVRQVLALVAVSMLAVGGFGILV